MKIDGTAALVTGAGSGLGAATAIKMARCGAKVALLDLNLGAAQRVLRDIAAQGGQALPLACDVTSRDSVQAAVDAAEFTRLATAIVENCALNGEVICLDGALRMASR